MARTGNAAVEASGSRESKPQAYPQGVARADRRWKWPMVPGVLQTQSADRATDTELGTLRAQPAADLQVLVANINAAASPLRTCPSSRKRAPGIHIGLVSDTTQVTTLPSG